MCEFVPVTEDVADKVDETLEVAHADREKMDEVGVREGVEEGEPPVGLPLRVAAPVEALGHTVEEGVEVDVDV